MLPNDSARIARCTRQVALAILFVFSNLPWGIGTLPSAGIVQVAANAFLATRVCFINAMAEVSEAAHADVTKLSVALRLDPRIGRPPCGLGSRRLDGGRR